MDALTSQLGGLNLTSSNASPTLIVYLVGKQGNLACCFHSSSDRFMIVQCLSVPATFDVDQLYYLKNVACGRAVFSVIGEQVRRQLVARHEYSFTREGYDNRVLRPLLLGARYRDFDQSCAVVVSLEPLIITMPSRPGFLKEAKFHTEHGESIHVRVNNVVREGSEERKMLKLFCTPFNRLSAGVERNTRLIFLEENVRLPIVTTALEYFCYGHRPIVNRALLDRIYGEPRSHSFSRVNQSLVTVIKGGRVISLNAEQSEAVRQYQSDCPAFVVEAPPGSGKTMTAAAMAVNYNGPGLQLFLSTANVPVFNIAFALAEIDYGDLKIGHLISADREAMQKDSERSPFSILDADDDEDNPRLERFRQLKAQLAYASKREQFAIRAQMRRVHADALAATPRYDIILATVDMILGKLLKKKNPKYPCPIQQQLEMRVRRIVIDEGSQMPEAALNALIHCFPHAQIAQIGDSKQLPPYKYVKGDIVSELAACSALEVMKRKKNVPVITLHTVYRAAPSLMKHYSDVFYDGKLVSGKPESKRVNLSVICRGITQRTMFVNVLDSKASQPKTGTSLINDAEVGALELIMNKLRQAGYDHESVMIIAYYEAQRKLAVSRVPEGYEVLTVDSAQGREKDIVIVLTTRDSAKNASAFFTCPLRCNVAVSRHKEALIVLGHSAIQEIEPWKQILTQKYFTTVTFGPAK